jgi:predicted acyl esterase
LQYHNTHAKFRMQVHLSALSKPERLIIGFCAGYAHVIANLRGTGGSEGTDGIFDARERDDVYDIVEWAAAQE